MMNVNCFFITIHARYLDAFDTRYQKMRSNFIKKFLMTEKSNLLINKFVSNAENRRRDIGGLVYQIILVFIFFISVVDKQI